MGGLRARPQNTPQPVFGAQICFSGSFVISFPLIN